MNYSVLVNAIIVKDGKVLISRRSDKDEHQKGKWTIPGGKLESLGVVLDAIEKTAEREAMEEVGVIIKPTKTIVATNTFEHDEDKKRVIAIVLLCDYVSGEPKPLEDTSEVKWISEKEIDDYDFSPNVDWYIRNYYEL